MCTHIPEQFAASVHNGAAQLVEARALQRADEMHTAYVATPLPFVLGFYCIDELGHGGLVHSVAVCSYLTIC